MSQPPTQPPHRGQQPADPNETLLLTGGQPYQPPASAPSGPPPPQEPAYGQAPQAHQGYPPQQHGHPSEAYQHQQAYPQQQGYPQQGYPQQGAYPHQQGGHGHAGQPSKQPLSGAARTIAALIALTAVVTGIGSVTEWVDGGEFGSVNGLDGDGVITLVFAIIVGGFAAVRLLGKLSLTAAIVGLILGLLTAGLALIDIADVRGSGFGFGVGFGLWLTLAGGIAMAAVSVVGLIKRR